MGVYIKICEICGKEYEASRPYSKYCSKLCRYKAIRSRVVLAPKYCKNCGGVLPTKIHNYCDKCIIDYYYKTKSKGAYEALVRRGYGGILMMEHLMKNKYKLK